MNNPRRMVCVGCAKHLGTIEKGKLHKKLKFICEDCDKKRKAAVWAMKTKKSNPLDGLFGYLCGG